MVIPWVLHLFLAEKYKLYFIFVKKTHAPHPRFGPYKNLCNSNLMSKIISIAEEWIALSIDTKYYTNYPHILQKRR